jgi:multicomponent Na+:H+ antiporter subunit D
MLLALLVPMAGALLIWVTGSWPNLREAVTLVTALTLFALVLSVLPHVIAGERPQVTLVEMFPGLSLAFTAEPLGATFATIASGLWIVTSLYSIGYMRGHHEHNQTRFYVFFALALASTIGVAFAGNMLTLFTFYEALSVSTYPLVTHSGTPEARRAGRAALAGIGEELVFRGVLQIWLEQWGYATSLIVSNIVFALCHAVTLTYAILAFVMGLFLGLIMDAPENRSLLAPILTHALYDFFAFCVLAVDWRKRNRESPEETFDFREEAPPMGEE